MDKDTGGLLNFSKAYHFIKQEVNEAVDAIRIAFKIPSAKVISSVNPADNQQKISTFTEDSQMNNMKPSSMHFISSPVINEMVPVFAYDSSRFYGPPLPIYDSITNSAQLVPTATSEYKPDFGVSPIQITPGDVAVQGRYGHAIVLSDKESRPTIRIGNGFRSRDASDVEVFNADEFSSELNSGSSAELVSFIDPLKLTASPSLSNIMPVFWWNIPCRRKATFISSRPVENRYANNRILYRSSVSSLEATIS